jgi:hypothetical protein
MKKKEILLWTLVVLALIANIVVPKMRRSYSWERDYNQRLAVDFDRTREDVKEYILQYIPDVTDGQIDEWTAGGKLENMRIGSRTMYFHNAAPNLFRIVPELVTLKNEVDDATIRPMTRVSSPGTKSLMHRKFQSSRKKSCEIWRMEAKTLS